jgi:peptidoglycan glycosyltransferase
MRAVVTDGTGSKAEGDGYQVAGKTGSAEFATGKETHAWFVGYADVEDPEIVVSVLVEEGGSGGSAAAPIARAVFDAYYGEE